MFDKSFNLGLVLLTIIKLIESDDVELSLEKLATWHFLIGCWDLGEPHQGSSRRSQKNGFSKKGG